MSFASNVQITSLTGSGQAVSGRTRLNGLYFTCGSTASTIDLYNGSAVAGDPLVSINTPASAGAHNVIIPDGGVLFTDGIYADLGADVASVSLVYVGGAKTSAPVVTTYSIPTDYHNIGLMFNALASNYLELTTTDWTNTAGANTLLAQTTGQVYTLFVPGLGTNITFTATGGWMPSGPGLYRMFGNIDTGGSTGTNVVGSVTFS